MKDKKYHYNFVLILIVIAIGIAVGIFLLITQKDGAKVTVSIDGELVSEYSLDTDGEYDIISDCNGCNHLVIHNGTARITEASCPDGLCVHMGEISKAGQSIICLPNKVVVEVIANESDTVDSVAR